MPEVRYQMSYNKTYNFDQDVLESTNITLTFNLLGTSPLQSDYILPWAYNNLPWVADKYDFQSYTINPNRDSDVKSFMSWTEVYTYSTSEEDKDIFDLRQTITMPVWRISFFEDSNKKIGGSNELVTKRLRQTFGLNPVSGTLSFKSFTKPVEDPYYYLGRTFTGFNGSIQSAVLNESTINGKVVYDMSISWTGGTVDSIPTYNI